MRVLATVALSAALLCSSARADETTPAAPAEGTVDMDSWETQVLGAIHGTYCGYYPTRVTIVGRAIGLTSFKQCSTLFAAMAPICIRELKAAGKWKVGSSPEGTRLGAELGTCIDAGFARATKKTR